MVDFAVANFTLSSQLTSCFYGSFECSNVCFWNMDNDTDKGQR